ncbi:MAG: hypothetical protein D6738_10085 [Acidobacteria bacterium]|nr:MAG: hypothetical protein D6738_10085 [Acidobacteriota bacterium]
MSAATEPGGGGVEAYAAELAVEYSRWTIGSETLIDRASWLEGIDGWLVEGWRVVERDTRMLEIRILGEYAATRRIVKESYVGPNGERSSSRSALAETWVRAGDGWRLLRVDANPLDDR